MNVAQTRLCLLLHGLSDVNDNSLTRLLLQCGSPAAIAASGPPLWRQMGFSSATIRALNRALAGRQDHCGLDVDAAAEALAATGAQILPICDPRYPPLLRTIHDPPPLLYVRGDPGALAAAQLAVVGSRKASSAGLRAAHSLCEQAAAAGLAICSGLALGIDGAAHRGALAAGGKSVAVMATGIDRLYPARHASLALELEQSGCLVTEFPPGVAPQRYNFPRRNRIISGLSLGVLVVEAAQPSGSLITSRTALEQGREVFALPWSIYHAGGAGCLGLIRDGAKMVEGIDDVLEELGSLYCLQQNLQQDLPQELSPAQGSGHEGPAAISPGQKRVLALVGYEVVTADELAQHSAMPVAQLLAELSALELQGLIEQGAGGYIRC